MWLKKKEERKKRDAGSGFQLIIEPNVLESLSTHGWWGLTVLSEEKPQALGLLVSPPCTSPSIVLPVKSPPLNQISKYWEVSWANITCSQSPATWIIDMKWTSGSLPWWFWGHGMESGNSWWVRTIKVEWCPTPCVFPLKLNYLHGPG